MGESHRPGLRLHSQEAVCSTAQVGPTRPLPAASTDATAHIAEHPDLAPGPRARTASAAPGAWTLLLPLSPPLPVNSAVPAALCHHVLSQSLAYGCLTGGAACCVQMQECRGRWVSLFCGGRDLPPGLYAWNSHVARESGTAMRDGNEDQIQLLEHRLSGGVSGFGRHSGLAGRTGSNK